ncbi:MAG: TonB-dependent receptor [Pigmentiphaga sp.]
MRLRKLPPSLAAYTFFSALQANAAEPVTTAVPQLDATTVSPSRYEASIWETPAAVHVVGPEAFEAGLGVNLSDGLGSVPGVQVQNRQNYAQDLQIIMRGFGARSTFGVRGLRLYVDDIPATMPDGQGQTSHIDLSSLERIETLNGPFSALYGNASGGVIRVYTAAGEAPPSVSFGAAGGSNDTFRVNLQAQGARDAGRGLQDYVLGATHFETAGYRDHSRARRDLANMRLGFVLPDDSTLKLVGNLVDVRALDPLGLTRAQLESDPRQAPLAEQYDTRKTVRQGQLGLVWDKPLNADNRLRLMAYGGQRDTLQFLSVPPAPQQNNPGHAGAVIDLDRRYGGAELRLTSAQQWLGRDAIVVAGLAYDHMVDDRRGYENFVVENGVTHLGVRGALRRDERNRVSSLDPYLHVSWWLTPRWTLDLGVRHSTVRFSATDHYVADGNFDDSGQTRYSAWSPSAALRWQASDDTQLYVSAGRGFETPTTTELAYRPDGNPGLNWDLQPSRSTHWEVGAKQRTPGGGLATLAAFRIDTRDEIVNAGSSNGRSSFRNAARTRRTGVELAWSQPFAQHALLQMAYTWMRAEFRGSTPGLDFGNRLPGVPQQSAYASIAWAPERGWQAAADLLYQGNIEVNDANSDAASAYTLLGLRGGYAWGWQDWEWDAFVRLDNVLDKHYVGSVIVNDRNERFFEPAPGRQWVVGIGGTWRF